MSLATLLSGAADIALDPTFGLAADYQRQPYTGGETNTITGLFALNRLRAEDKHTTDGRLQEFDATFTTDKDTILKPFDKIIRNGEQWNVESKLSEDSDLAVYGLQQIKRTTVTHVGNRS